MLKLKGSIKISGDKSISHRSIILGSLVKGKLAINNFLKSDDCLHTIAAMRSLGAKITNLNETNVGNLCSKSLK